jgi:hypothetical protein
VQFFVLFFLKNQVKKENLSNTDPNDPNVQPDSKAGQLRTAASIHSDVQGMKDAAPKSPTVDMSNVDYLQSKRTDYSAAIKKMGFTQQKGKKTG